MICHSRKALFRTTDGLKIAGVERSRLLKRFLCGLAQNVDCGVMIFYLIFIESISLLDAIPENNQNHPPIM
ncbi:MULTISPECIES: hypothetical protein [unclassified Microcoleus]|uniref:hypothetical protein n=1 Tax=unclassified Microcoleus TaxID=2642155 RepID=UPI002FD08824